MEQDLRNLGVASNNIHESKPALMSDGRQNCSWLSEAIVDSKFKSMSGSATNWEYRKYLTSNATQLMSNNMNNEMMNNVNNIAVTNGSNTSTPYNYTSINDNTLVRDGNFSSDLKQVYLSRQQLQSKMFTPSMYQGNQ
jgi:hypothetical protein